jgi:hypothetical protein
MAWLEAGIRLAGCVAWWELSGWEASCASAGPYIYSGGGHLGFGLALPNVGPPGGALPPEASQLASSAFVSQLLELLTSSGRADGRKQCGHVSCPAQVNHVPHG